MIEFAFIGIQLVNTYPIQEYNPDDPIVKITSDDESMVAITHRMNIIVWDLDTMVRRGTNLNDHRNEWSHEIDTLPDTIVDTTSNSLTTTLDSGIWYLHIRVRDNAGNWRFVARNQKD